MSRRILVTGARGFVGRHCLPALAKAGEEIHATGRNGPAPSGITAWYAADLLDPHDRARLLRAVRPHIVLHCAWSVEHGAFWTSPANLDWTGATLGLAREAFENGAVRFVGVGSCAEYDWTDGGAAPRRETDALGPDTLYGEAKAATFRVLDRYCAGSRLSFAWARLFHLFGAGEAAGRFVPSLLDELRAGRPAIVRNGDLVRDFMPIEDAGAALALLALSDVTGAVNIASGEPAALESFAHEVAEAAGLPGLVRIETPRDRGGQVPAMTADVGRLRREVGFSGLPRREALARFAAKAQLSFSGAKGRGTGFAPDQYGEATSPVST